MGPAGPRFAHSKQWYRRLLLEACSLDIQTGELQSAADNGGYASAANSSGRQ
jgi:hypothetical protein